MRHFVRRSSLLGLQFLPSITAAFRSSRKNDILYLILDFQKQQPALRSLVLAKFTQIHRFSSSQFLYPILLSTLLACGIYLFRVFYSDSWYYGNLVWNLLLAWLPYVCSIFAAGLYRLYPKHWWMFLFPGAVWLIFFPNAPYIVTDFYHLQERLPVPLWYDIGLIATFAWTGCFLAVASLKTMQFLVKTYAGRITSWLFVVIALGLSGVGIYLGRFERWNSWDLLFHPQMVFEDLAIPLMNPLHNLRFIGFSLMFMAILLVVYLMFTSINRAEKIGE
jgi:uncharacterized membrane protein